jgi:hypothetical protein
MRATLLAEDELSVNQIEPSGPTTIDVGWLALVVTGYSVTVPVTVIWPTLFAFVSVNHKSSSGELTMAVG